MPVHEPPRPLWYAIWTQSHFEQRVHDQLAAKGFRAFLPTLNRWSRRAGAQHLISVPMFPGYLFVQHDIDKASYIGILSCKGVVRILGERWDRLAPVPHAELDAVQQVQRMDCTVLPHPFLSEGQRVRIAAGPFAGIEGILIRTRPSRGLLVISVNLLQQSVAVEVDCTLVTPVGDTGDVRTPSCHPRLATAIA